MQMLSKLRSKLRITSMATLKISSKSKSKSKDIPFNIASPWGESIASYLGTTLEELKTNLPADPTLNSAVESTCALVRDYSIKTLVSRNSKSLTALKDICYGSGFLMHEKKLVMTGACNWTKAPKDEAGIQLGDGVNEIVGHCVNAEAPFVIKRNYSSPPETPAKKVDGFTSRLHNRHQLTLGFLQKNTNKSKFKQTSNDDIPM